MRTAFGKGTANSSVVWGRGNSKGAGRASSEEKRPDYGWQNPCVNTGASLTWGTHRTSAFGKEEEKNKPQWNQKKGGIHGCAPFVVHRFRSSSRRFDGHWLCRRDSKREGSRLGGVETGGWPERNEKRGGHCEPKDNQVVSFRGLEGWHLGAALRLAHSPGCMSHLRLTFPFCSC